MVTKTFINWKQKVLDSTGNLIEEIERSNYLGEKIHDSMRCCYCLNKITRWAEFMEHNGKYGFCRTTKPHECKEMKAYEQKKSLTTTK
jgi:hypothetical protein